MVPDPAIATAADYADAMMTARRAKNVLILLLLLLLLGQLALFFLVRYEVIVLPAAGAAGAASVATQPSDRWLDMLLHYLVSLTTFLGVTLTIVLGFVLLLIVNIMLVGRLIGVARLSSAYIWCLILLVLLFPWQSFLNNVGLTLQAADFKIPGALYTWYEFADRAGGAKFANEPLNLAILKWARFVGFPVLSLIIILAIQIKSNRGMRQALGEADADAALESPNP